MFKGSVWCEWNDKNDELGYFFLHNILQFYPGILGDDVL